MPAGPQFSLERQVAHLTFPLAVETAFGEQHDFLDGDADGNLSPDLENLRHGLPGPNPIVGVPCHGRDVVCE